ncbi:FkbM family methyltransferase [Clostridium saccharoperbutylacetonicum]|uniref:FkbM family methyltransferase n=1 Tax=Clostridium saccharoperbutylacetonicum TaxID=36745 RepID=UPI00098403C6|nr:FkbM family methyltransferase [Clostridium saccharoperbutylacetonicum]AQR96989.1 hypothetical protein CLSAP_43130 [Clostridium saccharoperbutylacetonicum]NSB32868.1 FkbM family methyltransferase [Clostridium saccharoperbutylacetonicum]
MELNYKSKYKEFMSNCKSDGVIFFGASEFGIIMSEKFKDMGINIKYFCDNDSNKWGKKIDNILVISTEELKQKDRNSNIMITTIFFEEVYEQLTKLGFKNIMYRAGGLDNNPFYSEIFIHDNIHKIEKVYNFLEDEKSKRVMNGIIKHRLTNDFECLLYENNQYFVSDIIHINEKEIFLDGGAYVGDTIEAFLKFSEKSFEKIYSFEPDKSNVAKLKDFIVNNKIEDKVIVEAKGLHSNTEILNFSSKCGSGSQISDNGDDTIEVVKIDEYFNNVPVTFIKMDIEGSEMDALRGAQETIKKNKPKLAICCYHKIDDLWEIPLMIKKILPEYKIYMRHHSKYLYETVCYAVME